ncbi:NYN domain-containing protein [Candidatus Dojkabacteria bacterium]|nr:NYN domain-containing protein [Candidatus Dojkabacteria bacterium]
MIVKNKSQRVVVLVDVQNLYYSARNIYNARINFKNLLKIALADRVLTRAIAYVIKSDVSVKEEEFFSAVNNAGFEIKEKELQIFPGGAKKGDWDVGIAMDAIRLGVKVDSVILISGDGDYVPVVHYLQQSLGCLVEVVAFDKTCSKSLKEVCDDFISIESHSQDLLFSIDKKIVERSGIASRNMKMLPKKIRPLRKSNKVFSSKPARKKDQSIGNVRPSVVVKPVVQNS